MDKDNYSVFEFACQAIRQSNQWVIHIYYILGTQPRLRLWRAYLRNGRRNSRGARNDIPQISAECITPIDTRAEIAKIAGVSHDTVAKVKKIVTPARTAVILKSENPAIVPISTMHEVAKLAGVGHDALKLEHTEMVSVPAFTVMRPAVAKSTINRVVQDGRF